MDILTAILTALLVSFSLSYTLVSLWSINNYSAKIYEELRRLNVKTTTSKTITTNTYVKNENDLEKIAKEIDDKLRK